LKAHVLENIDSYTSHYRSPPSDTDCYCLAFGLLRNGIVVTDDLGMHQLANDFEITIWHGHQLMKKMLSAKVIEKDLFKEIYLALETNEDIPKTWTEAKHTIYKKIFGPKPQP
jgi:hypothetical protein